MADKISAKIQGIPNILEYYASLKRVPLADVLRHAANDIAYAAYKTVPVANDRGRSHWALLPGFGSKKGKCVKVNLDQQEALEKSRSHRNFKDKKKRWKPGGHLARLKLFRFANIHRGFAKSVFIPLFKELGFEKRKKDKPSGSDESNFNKYRYGFSKFASEKNPYRGNLFKASIELRQKMRQVDLSRRSDVEKAAGTGQTRPVMSFKVSEPNLQSYPGWSERALSEGFNRAAAIILRDLRKVIGSKNPAKEKIDT